MLKRILLWTAAILALLVIGFVVLVFRQPDDFVIRRSETMNAPPEVVFTQVNDLHNWQQWSPWAKLDPNAKNSFEGPSAGEGAVFRWSGNDEVGEGKMTIIESKPDKLVRMKIEFVRPMEDQADTTFEIEPIGDQTKMTWTMSGKNSLTGKVMGVVMDMDKMVGGYFVEGLTNLKGIVEAKSAAKDEGQPPGAETSTTSE